MTEWAVYKSDDGWLIGAPVAHVVWKGESATDLDEQLAQWGMKRSQLTNFESAELRAEFEAAFGPIAGAAPATSSQSA